MDFSTSWTWTAPIVLGAFHGLNPAMGWLFAVARGLQERRMKAVVKSLVPIGIGHALAIIAVAAPFWLLQVVVSQQFLMILAGVSLVTFALYRVATRFRHFRWVGMRINGLQLVLWSALMAAAHGAGLMLIPALAQLSGDSADEALAHDLRHHEHLAESATSLVPALAGVMLHTAAMLIMMGIMSVIVYRWIGIEILRKTWINLDLIWTAVLLIGGAVTIGLAVFPVS